MLNIKLKRQNHHTIKILINLNSSTTHNYLGLEIFAASAGGAYLVTAQRISAAFAWTSGESCNIGKIKRITLNAKGTNSQENVIHSVQLLHKHDNVNQNLNHYILGLEEIGLVI